MPSVRAANRYGRNHNAQQRRSLHCNRGNQQCECEDLGQRSVGQDEDRRIEGRDPGEQSEGQEDHRAQGVEEEDHRHPRHLGVHDRRRGLADIGEGRH